MAAYVVVEVDVKDPEGYADYRQLSSAAAAQYGGEFLARGGNIVPLEGNWNPQRLVILRFASVEQARQWYDSPEYSAAKTLRHKYAESKMLIIEGV